MAVLTEQQRVEAWREYMARVSSDREALTLTKAQLRSALDSADQWVSDNQASYNSALPAAAQAALTSDQKARLLTYVLGKRFLEGVV